ncbi:7360_t:CDS:1, partial [Cetraspora pellucida]
MNLTAKSHYVVILKDSTVLCTCMQIINFGMLCRHQYRIFIQSSIAVFHLGLIYTRWFKSILFEANQHITIFQGIKNFTPAPLHYINQIQTANIYTSTIKENVDKKVQFGNMMSIAKTSVQIAVTE